MEYRKFLTEIESNDISKTYVYDKDNDVVIYKPNCANNLKINKDIFDILRNFMGNNIVNISEIVYGDNKYIGNKICGYIKKHYKEDKVSLLDKDLEYLTRNIEQSYKLFNELADNHIMVNGFDIKKVIIDEENIVLPYPEQCEYSLKSVEEIRKNNLSNLEIIYKLLLFRDIDIKAFDKYIQLFDCQCEELVDNFTKKIGTNKKIREYLNN